MPLASIVWSVARPRPRRDGDALPGRSTPTDRLYRRLRDVPIAAIVGGRGLAVTLSALPLAGLDRRRSSPCPMTVAPRPTPAAARYRSTALADPDAVLSTLLPYRFVRDELAGHPVGNLALATLADLDRGLVEAWTRPRGCSDCTAASSPRRWRRSSCADKSTAKRSRAGKPYTDHRPHRAGLARAAGADGCARGGRSGQGGGYGADRPGSTFTSLIPNLLVPDLAAVLVRRPKRVVYVCNLTSRQRETSGIPLKAHLRVLLAPCPGLAVQAGGVSAADPAARSRERGVFAELAAEVVHGQLRAIDQPHHHDPGLLAAALRRLDA
jgi:2-phospho-L-lactate transferase CofD